MYGTHPARYAAECQCVKAGQGNEHSNVPIMYFFSSIARRLPDLDAIASEAHRPWWFCTRGNACLHGLHATAFCSERPCNPLSGNRKKCFRAFSTTRLITGMLQPARPRRTQCGVPAGRGGARAAAEGAGRRGGGLPPDGRAVLSHHRLHLRRVRGEPTCPTRTVARKFWVSRISDLVRNPQEGVL